jgi:hypothetical protein
VVLSAAALIWTASRASALALLVVGLLELLRKRRYGLVIALAAVLLIGVLVMGGTEAPLGPFGGLLRTTDSRSSTVEAALADFGTSPCGASVSVPKHQPSPHHSSEH